MAKFNFKKAISDAGTKAVPAAVGGVSSIVVAKLIPKTMKENYRRLLPLGLGVAAIAMFPKYPAVQFAGAGLMGKAIGDMAENWGIGAPSNYPMPNRHKQLFYRVDRGRSMNAPTDLSQNFTINKPTDLSQNFTMNGMPGMVTANNMEEAYGGSQN